MELLTYEEMIISDEAPEGMKRVEAVDEEKLVDTIAAGEEQNVEIKSYVYSNYSGEEQRIDVFIPKKREGKLPLAFYVPGSGWTRQDEKYNNQFMVLLANRGFISCKAYYRPSSVAPHPAQVTDIKNALRFMIKNADEIGIDVDRIAICGDSSGGHVVSFIGITGDGEPVDSLYSDVKIKVRCVVDFFGPSDIYYLNDYPTMTDMINEDSYAGMLIGGRNVKENKALADEASPVNYIKRDGKYPAFFIAHGNRDTIVCFNQSVRLYEKLREVGADVEFYAIQAAGHWEHGFHSRKVLGMALDFMKEHTK